MGGIVPLVCMQIGFAFWKNCSIVVVVPLFQHDDGLIP